MVSLTSPYIELKTSLSSSPLRSNPVHHFHHPPITVHHERERGRMHHHQGLSRYDDSKFSPLSLNIVLDSTPGKEVSVHGSAELRSVEVEIPESAIASLWFNEPLITTSMERNAYGDRLSTPLPQAAGDPCVLFVEGPWNKSEECSPFPLISCSAS